MKFYSSSLLSKIFLRLLLNLLIILLLVGGFFTFNSKVDLRNLLGSEANNRLRIAGRQISFDLSKSPVSDWQEIIARHSLFHQISFVLILGDGRTVAQVDRNIPSSVKSAAIKRIRRVPNDFERIFRKPPRERPGERFKRKHVFRHDFFFQVRTSNPTEYWVGIMIPLFGAPEVPPEPIMLLAVSDSITGGGFFFDPSPWIMIAILIMLVSIIIWVPVVRNITKPLAKMTTAAESIAKGQFDVFIKENRKDEIGRLAQAINHMTARLSSYVKGQKRFLGDIAHELGSPVARIQFGLEILERKIQEDGKQNLQDVKEDVAELSNLINELLSFTRAEMTPERVELAEVELLSVVKKVVQREKENGIKIDVFIDPNLQVLANGELLARAISNLIRNAIRYAGEKGPISIKAKAKSESVEVEVRDSGDGVDAAHLDQLFEPFYRTESSRNRETGGVGLGLAIVKTCMEACQGTAVARNLQPKGFSVILTLKKSVSSF